MTSLEKPEGSRSALGIRGRSFGRIFGSRSLFAAFGLVFTSGIEELLELAEGVERLLPVIASFESGGGGAAGLAGLGGTTEAGGLGSNRLGGPLRPPPDPPPWPPGRGPPRPWPPPPAGRKLLSRPPVLGGSGRLWGGPSPGPPWCGGPAGVPTGGDRQIRGRSLVATRTATGPARAGSTLTASILRPFALLASTAASHLHFRRLR